MDKTIDKEELNKKIVKWRRTLERHSEKETFLLDRIKKDQEYVAYLGVRKQKLTEWIVEAEKQLQE